MTAPQTSSGEVAPVSVSEGKRSATDGTTGPRPAAGFHDQPPTPERMLQIALDKIHLGIDPQRLVGVAIAYRDKWAWLVEQQEAGAQLDGRASIYTGETYTQARDRWEAYRLLLVEETCGSHGAC